MSPERAEHATPYLPVGLGIIASLLGDEGHQVRILDAYTEGWEFRGRLEDGRIEIGLAEAEIAVQIRRFQPQVVGFSVSFPSQMLRVRSLARWVKIIHPEIFVICGGNYPTCTPAEVLAIPEVDAVVLGEGEVPLRTMLEILETGRRIDGLEGTACRTAAGKLSVTPASQCLDNLDQLPSPAYDLLPLETYFRLAGGRKMPLMTTRGCGNSCAFCSTAMLFGKQVRSFTPEYILQQMNLLAEFYGVREFRFDDDALLADTERAGQFFAALLNNSLRLPWTARAGVNAQDLDEHLLQKMKRAGGKRLHFEVGSGSRRIQYRILQRAQDLFQVEQAIKRALAAGFEVCCEFLLGNPSETVEEVYETLNFAWKLRSMGAEQFQFTLYEAPMEQPTTDGLAEEIARICATAESEFSSRGIVAGFTRKNNANRRVLGHTEDRFFHSVAPRPGLRVQNTTADHAAAAESITS